MDHDIIGDVHGHADALPALLAHLGYRKTGAAWGHPSRTAIFVGDFIDGGPGKLDTVRLVQNMGTPAPLSSRAACVDYSVAKGGKLVAYRWAAGEPFRPRISPGSAHRALR